MMASTIAPTMKTAPSTVVARVSTVAPARAPNAAWLPLPPKAAAMSPPLPCCSRTTTTSSRQASTYSADRTMLNMADDYTVAARLLATISAKPPASRPAPPTRAPSTSGCAESAPALAGLTLPP